MSGWDAVCMCRESDNLTRLYLPFFYDIEGILVKNN